MSTATSTGTTRTGSTPIPVAPSAVPASSAAAFVHDTVLVLTRELRPLRREPLSVLFSMIQPLVFLALFAPLLTAVPGVDASPLQWFVPGIVVMSCLMGASMTGANLTVEIQTGAHERMLVAPLRRSSLVVGRSLKEIVPMIAQALLVLAIVTPTGFDLHVTGVAIGLVVLALFCIGVGALSYSLALASKDQEWLFWTVQQALLFPVLLLAGMLLPVEDGPGWLRALSQLNPLTYVVDAERALFAGELWSSTVVQGLAAAALVGAFGLRVGIRSMQRSS
jgi:ABC-2 type transport system permease protein